MLITICAFFRNIKLIMESRRYKEWPRSWGLKLDTVRLESGSFSVQGE